MEQRGEQQSQQQPESTVADSGSGPLIEPGRSERKGRGGKKKGKPRGRSFQKGQSGNPSGKPKPREPRPEPVYDEDPVPEPELRPGESEPSELLRDLRWAYRNFGVRCRGTVHQMEYREMIARDREGFTALLGKHEQMHRAGQGRRGAGGGVEAEVEEEGERDPGTVAALALIEKILKEAE